MKFTSVFTAVLALHIAIVGLLFVQPGCSSTEKRPEPRDTTRVMGETDAAEDLGSHQPGAHDDLNAMAFTSTRDGRQTRDLRPPSRPTWTVYEESSVVVEDVTDPIPSEVLRPVTPTRTETAEAASAPAYGEYTVQRGDSLWAIARREGVPLDALLEANDMTRDSVLRVGQRLRIPGRSPSLPTEAAEAPVVASGVDQEASRHTVQRGDTLSGLASRYGTTVRAIQSANRMQGTTIRVGQELVIPGRAESATAAPQREAATGTSRTHTVRAGETLGAIASRYGVTVQDLQRDNGIQDPRRLRVGQELIVRGGSAPSPERSAEARPETRERTATESAQRTAREERPAREERTERPATGPAPSPDAVQVNVIEVETSEIDPLDFLDDVPEVQAEEVD